MRFNWNRVAKRFYKALPQMNLRSMRKRNGRAGMPGMPLLGNLALIALRPVRGRDSASDSPNRDNPAHRRLLRRRSVLAEIPDRADGSGAGVRLYPRGVGLPEIGGAVAAASSSRLARRGPGRAQVLLDLWAALSRPRLLSGSTMMP